MAINPESRYPGQISPSDAEYPYGKARNITQPGDGSGTPWEAALVNDIFGFQQALLSAAEITPSGDPETATNSQYLNALDARYGLNLLQTTGDSETQAMSQAAVTTAVAEAQATADEALSIVAVNETASVTWNMETDTYSGRPYATPVHRNMRRCLLLPNGTVNYYLDDIDSTKKADGTDAVLDGTDGQVMVEIPETYVRTILRGSVVTWEVAHVPTEGFALHPAFEDGAVSAVYVGAYDAVVWDESAGAVIDGLNLDDNTSRVDLVNDQMYSTSGNFAMVGLTRDQFRQLARNTGYQLYDYYQWHLVQLLWITEYGSWNSQDVLGRGNVDAGSYPASSSNQASSPHTVNGLSNQFGNYSGSVATGDGEPFVTYRGIENVWGNCWQFIDGVNVNNRQIFASTNEATFEDDIGTGDYSSVGTALPTATDASIKDWQAVEHVFVPKTVNDGASSSTYVGDSLWTDTGWRTMYVGGSAHDAAYAGLCACFANRAASHRNRNLGSRLSRKIRV